MFSSQNCMHPWKTDRRLCLLAMWDLKKNSSSHWMCSALQILDICYKLHYIILVILFCREIEDVLKTGKRKKREDSSGSSSEISQSYMEDSRRLLSDTSTSLGGHEKTFKQVLNR